MRCLASIIAQTKRKMDIPVQKLYDNMNCTRLFSSKADENFAYHNQDPRSSAAMSHQSFDN